MTLLTIMRHAKSDWDDPKLDDFDRPLSARGRKAAKAIGQELRCRRMRFDLVIASPAERVRETLALVERGYRKAFETRFETALYGASETPLLDLVRAIPETVHAPLLVGHNPDLHQLALGLARNDERGFRERIRDNLPTAAVAIIELPVVRWAEVAPESGEIVALILPRELD